MNLILFGIIVLIMWKLIKTIWDDIRLKRTNPEAHRRKHMTVKEKLNEDYGLDELPSGVKVKERPSDSGDKNYYTLNLPHWTYSNKDGKRDRRRKNNYVKYSRNKLYFNDYLLSSEYPLDIVYLVNKLRTEDHQIDMIPFEKARYDYLVKFYSEFNRAKMINNLYDQFSDDPYKFEEYCANIYRSLGKKAEVTSKTNDGGYDILVTNEDESKTIVECKCFQPGHQVGRPAIQKLVGANVLVGAKEMVFITTSSFSNEAVNYGKKVGVKLIDGHELFSDDIANQMTITYDDWRIHDEDVLRSLPEDLRDKAQMKSYSMVPNKIRKAKQKKTDQQQSNC